MHSSTCNTVLRRYIHRHIFRNSRTETKHIFNRSCLSVFPTCTPNFPYGISTRRRIVVRFADKFWTFYWFMGVGYYYLLVKREAFGLGGYSCETTLERIHSVSSSIFTNEKKNRSRIEWTNCHTFQLQFVCSIWDERQFVSSVDWLQKSNCGQRGIFRWEVSSLQVRVGLLCRLRALDKITRWKKTLVRVVPQLVRCVL